MSLIEAAAIAVGSFVIGAFWMWRIWDAALREFEESNDHEGSARYRIAKFIR